MPTPSRRQTYLTVLVAGLAVAALFGLFALPGGKAEAQGRMSAPACQCSDPTSISSMSSIVVHCLCGGMSCVLSQSTASSVTNMMQCVK